MTAYGDSWQQDAPKSSEVKAYRRDFNRRVWLGVIPAVTIGQTQVLGAVVSFPKPPFVPGQGSSANITSNYQSVYAVSWNLTDFLLKRQSATDAVNANLDAQFKMRSSATSGLLASYATRRAAQFALRESLLDLTASQSSCSERTKDLLKSVEDSVVALVKSYSEIDAATHGGASEAYKAYAPYAP